MDEMCARCGERLADDDYDWEMIADVMVCGNCVTPEETDAALERLDEASQWFLRLDREILIASEWEDDAEPKVWARALRRDHGREGAVQAILGASCPPAVRRVALEELAL